jgi:two-component system, sensor histidine kinase
MKETARILIVEDEALIAKGIERCVTSRGYVVRDTVDTAELAIARAAEGIDLVLMDVLLKGPHDGSWAAMQIRSLYDVPVIFLTAYGDAATLNRASLSGPYAYVVKPFRDDELIRSIEVALSLHRVQKALCRMEIQDALGKLVAGLAHEARNPLFGLTSTVEALAASRMTRETSATYLSVIQEQARRLNALVTRLTEIGNPSRPGLEFSLLDAARNAVRCCRASATGRAVLIQIEGPETLAFGDCDRVEATLTDLVGNAIMATPEEGSVRITVRAVTAGDEKWAEVEIEDEGRPLGAPTGTELSNAGTTSHLGLGLAIADYVAREHGGALSTGKGQRGGGSVVMRLPAA